MCHIASNSRTEWFLFLGALVMLARLCMCVCVCAIMIYVSVVAFMLAAPIDQLHPLLNSDTLNIH